MDMIGGGGGGSSGWLGAVPSVILGDVVSCWALHTIELAASSAGLNQSFGT